MRYPPSPHRNEKINVVLLYAPVKRLKQLSGWAPCLKYFCCGALSEGEHRRVGIKSVLVEKVSKVRVTSMRNQLIKDVRNMVTGFLKNNRSEPSTSGRNNIGGFLRASP